MDAAHGICAGVALGEDGDFLAVDHEAERALFVGALDGAVLRLADEAAVDLRTDGGREGGERRREEIERELE